jgi:hypothetical protein
VSDEKTDYSNVNIQELRTLRRLAEQIKSALNASPFGLESFREFVKSAILAGAQHPYHDRALATAESELPQLLQDIEAFERGHQEYWMELRGGREAGLKAAEQLAAVSRAAKMRVNVTENWTPPLVRPPTNEVYPPPRATIPLDDVAKADGLNGIVEYVFNEFGAEVTTRTIQNWRDSGSLKMTQRGTLWEFSKSDLEALASKQNRQKRQS